MSISPSAWARCCNNTSRPKHNALEAAWQIRIPSCRPNQHLTSRRNYRSGPSQSSLSKRLHGTGYYAPGDILSIQGKRFTLLSQISSRWVHDLVPTLKSPAGTLQTQYISTHFARNKDTGNPSIIRTIQQTRDPALNHEGHYVRHETNTIHDVASYIDMQRGQFNCWHNTLHITHDSRPGPKRPFKNPVQGPRMQMPGGYIGHVVFSTLHRGSLKTWGEIGVEELEKDPKYAIGLLNLYNSLDCNHQGYHGPKRPLTVAGSRWRDILWDPKHEQCLTLDYAWAPHDRVHAQQVVRTNPLDLRAPDVGFSPFPQGFLTENEFLPLKMQPA